MNIVKWRSLFDGFWSVDPTTGRGHSAFDLNDVLCEIVKRLSRPLRIKFPDAWYHVMNRGRRSEEIFFSNADREEFLPVLVAQGDALNLLTYY